MSDDGTVELRLRRTPVAGPVVERLVTAVGARAGLSIERLDEAQITVGTAVRDAWDALVGDTMDVRMDAGDGRVVIRLGPFADGGASRVARQAAVPGGGVVERLSSAWADTPSGDGRSVLEIVID